MLLYPHKVWMYSVVVLCHHMITNQHSTNIWYLLHVCTLQVDVIRPIHIPILGTTEIPLDRCQCSPIPVDVDQCQCSPIPLGVVCGTPASLVTTAHLPSTSSFSPGHSLFSAPSRTPLSPSPSPSLQSSPGRGKLNSWLLLFLVSSKYTKSLL